VVSKNLVLGRGTDPDYLTGKAILWGLNTKVGVIAKVGVQRRCIPLPNYFRHLFKKRILTCWRRKLMHSAFVSLIIIVYLYHAVFLVDDNDNENDEMF